MTSVVVRPVRFTDQVAAMRQFLELVGLRPWIVADRPGWADMACGGGRVALHAAATSDTGGQPGETRLSFEADDVTALAKQLTDAGVSSVAVYDESYGHVLTCEDPLGDVITVDEQMTDLYGYQLHTAAVPATLRVTPVRFTDPTGPYGSFLQTLGLRPAGEINPYYVNFRAADGTHGQVGLHYVFDEVLPVASGRGAAVQLNFESAEPLEDLAARLSNAGFPAEIKVADFGSSIVVFDPDGQEIQVHQPSGQ
jgi:catechol 2,3-dioxygenase-like lactoylglutathione lyase family enzyme